MPRNIHPESAYQLYVVPEYLTDGTLIYVAWHPELPHVLAHGSTPEGAEQSLAEGFAIYAEYAAEHGIELPPPRRIGARQVIWRTVPLTRQPSASVIPLGAARAANLAIPTSEP